MAPLKGLYRIENKVNGIIGPEGIPQKDQPSPVSKIFDGAEPGLFRIEPSSAGSNQYYIVALIENGIYDTVDIDRKVYVRVPNGEQYQSWLILNATDGSHLILQADTHDHWELSNPIPRTQVTMLEPGIFRENDYFYLKKLSSD